jgi:hypothetical protein
MSEPLSLTVFTIEADRKPLLAFAAKKQQEVEDFCADERVRAKLWSVRSGGVPICDDRSIFRVRLANQAERARYREKATTRALENPAAVFLVDVDE